MKNDYRKLDDLYHIVEQHKQLSMKKTIAVLLCALCFINISKSQNNVLFWWSFDEPKGNAGSTIQTGNLNNDDNTTIVPYNKYKTGGLTNYVPGVKGSAIKFDGFSSFIDVTPPDLKDKNNPYAKKFRLPRQIGFEAWVSLGAYPWNWKFPTVKPSGRFAANYTRLKYYPEWDAVWPAGPFNDVVVQFDELPIKIMFWRGTRYSPCLVSENGKWMADQSRETGNNWFLEQGSRDELSTGCMEHMSDTQCRSSRVAVIESNDARVVVNWRYLQMDVKFRQNDLPDNTGFGELAAATLVTMKGKTKTYSREKGYPKYDMPEANIQVVNFKSKFKPFLILRTGGTFSVFNGEVRPAYSHFPWWNHWPVAQAVSDGRSAIAPDQAAHSSLSWGDTDFDAALYGMTDKDPKTLVRLARSWNFPAEIKLSKPSSGTCQYDMTQRAYIIDAKNNTESLKFNLNAREDSPVLNPAFVISNWVNSDIRLTINGKVINHGKDFRYSIQYDVEGNPSVIVWIKYLAEKAVEFELAPIK